MKRTDRAIGVVLGVVLGVVIVVAFVFFGSEGTIDAPRISPGSGDTPSTTPARHKPKPQEPKPSTRAATVTISGGAPPASGPAQLEAREGDRVRLEVNSDETVGVELLGYGISTTVDAGKRSVVAFTATKTGNFPLIVSGSHIAVAQIRVAGPR